MQTIFGIWGLWDYMVSIMDEIVFDDPYRELADFSIGCLPP